MKPLASLLQVAPRSKVNSERAALLEEMLHEINKERIGTKYPPMKAKLLGIKVAHLSLHDLHYTHSICRDYKNRKGSYSKALFGSLKLKV